MSEFATFIGSVDEKLTETYSKLLKDPQDAVKTEAVNTSIALVKLMKNQSENSIMNALKEGLESTSWRLRFSIAE